MRKKRSSWNYYTWDPTEFRLDNRIRKLDGLDIAILRAIHDAIWLTGEQRIYNDIVALVTELDIPSDILEPAITRLLKRKALYIMDCFIHSPHIDQCWQVCLKASKINSANRKQAESLKNVTTVNGPS